MEANNNEFYDPELVAIYNTVCALDGYEQFYFKLAKKIRAKTIIDIGCGTGLVTCQLAKQGYNVIGIEPSNAMLDVARKSPHGDKVKWIQGYASSLHEFKADLAIMTAHVAQFFLGEEEWDKALKSIYNALRLGGYLAFESRNPDVQPWLSKEKHAFVDWYTSDFSKKVIDTVAGPIEVRNEITEIKGNKVTSELHYIFTRTGKELSSRNTLIFRSRKELTQSLEKVGFTIENVFGDWGGRIATSESPEFIFVAKRM